MGRPGDELADTARHGRNWTAFFNTGRRSGCGRSTYGAAKDVGVDLTADAICGLAAVTVS
jgi:hypothetical protein